MTASDWVSLLLGAVLTVVAIVLALAFTVWAVAEIGDVIGFWTLPTSDCTEQVAA